MGTALERLEDDHATAAARTGVSERLKLGFQERMLALQTFCNAFFTYYDRYIDERRDEERACSSG